MNWSNFLSIVFENSRNYTVLAVITFFIFYVVLKNKKALKKIQINYPSANDYQREISYSIVTILIFSIPPLVLLFNDSVRPFTKYYADINLYNRVYFFAAFVLMILIHDTYFYWMHRLMHHKALFRLFHRVHHKSTNPTPLAAYAFHPFEAVVESGIFVLLLFIMPLHDYHLIVFFIGSLAYNVYGHLGFELFPVGFNKHWFGKWLTSSVNHNQHHQYFKGNYGLYFTFWDKLMGTLRADYDKAFEDAKRK
jgi:sterol desaturase/sphingolipid hydroxylase (fatty acid hydroxylase superfamily)